MSFVSSLEPRPLWRHFDRILEINRPSKQEEAMRRYVLQVAEEQGLDHRTDEAGNVVVRKPGSLGHEEAPITVLQSHLDMVQEKNSDVDFDWASDAIRPVRQDGYLTADGTTLGSDNGIGVAAMLAVLEAEEIPHGPLELLFTIDEETGLTGAARLGEDMLVGRRLINLDSEEEGSLYVGCAGGADASLTLPLGTTPPDAGSEALTVQLGGLKGGHSGVDIHLQRGNAVQLLARAVLTGGGGEELRLAGFLGGSAHNAIPREARAVVVASPEALATFREGLERELGAIREEYRPAEPDLAWKIAGAETPEEVWDEATSGKVLRLLNALPHGVQAMSYDIPELVETSTNLATVLEEDGELKVLTSSRSSVDSALAALQGRIRAGGELAGARVEAGGGYPGWAPDLSSPLLGVLKQVYAEEVGEEPAVKAIHAGLECGIIGEKFDGMDMISFGPQIEYPHSPDERVEISSVERFHRVLVAALERLAREG